PGVLRLLPRPLAADAGLPAGPDRHGPANLPARVDAEQPALRRRSGRRGAGAAAGVAARRHWPAPRRAMSPARRRRRGRRRRVAALRRRGRMGGQGADGHRPLAGADVVPGVVPGRGHVPGAGTPRQQPGTEPDGGGPGRAGGRPAVHRRRLLAARPGLRQPAVPRRLFLQRAAALQPGLQPRPDRHAPPGAVRQRDPVLLVPHRAQSGEETMAVRERPRGRFWSRLHFLIRFLGLTGLLAVAVGGVLGYLHDLWPGVEEAWRTSWQAGWEKTETLLKEGAGEPAATVAIYLVAAGAAAALFALLIDLLAGLWLAACRRSAVGLN